MQKERDPGLLFPGWQQIKWAQGDLVNRHRMLCIGLQITKRKEDCESHTFFFKVLSLSNYNYELEMSVFLVFFIFKLLAVLISF